MILRPKKQSKYNPLTEKNKIKIIELFFSKKNNTSAAIAAEVNEPVSRVDTVINNYLKTIKTPTN